MVREADGRVHDNAYPRLHRVGPDAPSTPWCLRLADAFGAFRLLCFDFDAKTLDQREQAEDDCDALGALLEGLGIDHVVCRSSAGGGRHLWVAMASGAPAALVGRIAETAHATYRSLDHGMLRNPAEGAARPPGSPHRDGSTSIVLRGDLLDLCAPRTTVADLEQLAAALIEQMPAVQHTDSRPAGPQDANYQPAKDLSRWGAGHMATIGGGPNPSWTGFMCLLAAASAGWSAHDVASAAQTAPGMEHYRTKNTSRGARRARSVSEARSRLARQWATAQHYASLHRALPRTDPVLDLTDLEQLVSGVEGLLHRLKVSPGQLGTTDAALSHRSVLHAIAYLTLQTGKPTVAASIRDLALMTGLGRTTVASSLRALAERGQLRRVDLAEGPNAAEWRLPPGISTGAGEHRSQLFNNPRPPADLFAVRASLSRSLEVLLTDERHDVFTHRGLGHVAGRAYAMLRDSSALTRDAVARDLGVGVGRAGELLSRLWRHRLIRRDGCGWTRVRRDLRGAAARRLKVVGVLIDRARRYAEEREVWAWWQAEYATMTQQPRGRPRRQGVSARALFEEATPGERVWPRYPRDAHGLADHREARYWVVEGVLRPESRWQLVA